LVSRKAFNQLILDSHPSLHRREILQIVYVAPATGAQVSLPHQRKKSPSVGHCPTLQTPLGYWEDLWWNQRVQKIPTRCMPTSSA